MNKIVSDGENQKEVKTNGSDNWVNRVGMVGHGSESVGPMLGGIRKSATYEWTQAGQGGTVMERYLYEWECPKCGALLTGEFDDVSFGNDLRDHRLSHSEVKS